MTARANSKEAIKAAWDGRVDSYAKTVNDPMQRGLAVEIELSAFVRALPRRSGLHLLDAGCGVGIHGLRLLDQGHSVTFVDVSPNMLDKARQASKKVDGRSIPDFQELDIRNMHILASNSFDGVIAGGTVISDCGDPFEAMTELARILCSGGIMGVSLRNLDGPQNKNHCKVVPSGGPGFDWWFFSVTTAADICHRCGIVFEHAYPVMMSPPTPENAQHYVQLHLDATDSENWKAQAWEIFVIGRKNGAKI